MQHSPQEIKTRLGEAVDPEGNVLNMAAVVEVIGLLERTPLTKEALEQTRIGRTVNLLRKKTENEDIARRAKKLVKKWQKLVQNHLEAVRNTNSPLNGLRCNSPLVNGSIKDEEKTGGEATVKPKQIDRINKGTKRKRSSSDTPPPGGGNLNEVTRTKKKEGNEDKDGSLCSSQSSQDREDSQNNINQTDRSLDLAGNDETCLTKRLKVEDIDAETVCGNKQKAVDELTIEAVVVDELTIENTNLPALLRHEKTKTLDHNDVRWEGNDFSQQTDDLIESETAENQQDPVSLPLGIEEQVNGVTGYFGEDGKWYSWSQTMPFNGGNLIVLPYILLE